MSYLEILILSFIEGLTEFLPISSTAHLILANRLMGIESNDFTKAFDVIIQFGAIAAVIVIYFKNFKWDYLFYQKLFIGFIPTALLGFVLKKHVTSWMENYTLICWALIVGGLIMILTDYYFKKNETKSDQLNLKNSFFIGFAQILALIPGVSRSASTIIAGQFFGLSKKKAAEFSFFLAVPTLTTATFYKLYKIKDILSSQNTTDLILGVLLSFAFALLAIKFFIHVVQKYGFFWFGIYRILIGIVLLLYLKN